MRHAATCCGLLSHDACSGKILGEPAPNSNRSFMPHFSNVMKHIYIDCNFAKVEIIC
jgi:hypothetical protein